MLTYEALVESAGGLGSITEESWGWTIELRGFGRRSMYFNLNDPKGSYSGDGLIDLNTGDAYNRELFRYLEKSFENPLQPTTDELILWGLETEIPYPLQATEKN